MFDAMELTKQKNYRQAFDLASASLRGMDLQERATQAGASYQKRKDREEILIDFLSEPHLIFFPTMEFETQTKKPVSLVTRTILLHYLLRADGTPLTGKWIAYQEIPGGLLYASVFGRRVTEPIVKKFGRSARSFAETGLHLGGRSAGVGDASLIFQVLPRVPVQYVLWEGDDEFPAKAHLLFDASIDHYLSLEDIVVLGQMVTTRLIHRSTRSGASQAEEGQLVEPDID
jgi:hypothetical protein